VGDRIVVTGGTGTIGRHVVPLLVDAGREVRVLTRHGGPSSPGVEHVHGDTLCGVGLDDAFTGADTVLHLAGGPRGDDVAMQHVVTAARRAGVRHLVLVSVTGADRVPVGYFRAKARSEEILAGSGVPWTVLRVAQLHEFVLPLVRALRRLPVLPVIRGLRVEPVDVHDAAARLAELTLADPAGRVRDLAGPQVHDLGSLLGATGVSRRISLRVPFPGPVGRAYRAGANLSADPERGTGTFAQFWSR